MNLPSRRRFGSGWFFAGGLAIVLLIGAIAVVLSRDTSDEGGENGEKDGSVEIAASVSLDGQSLPVATSASEDPAVGRRAPVARGQDFDGLPVSIGEGGRAQLVVFLAHWCPQCQVEVPRLVAFEEAGGIPAVLEVVAVATGTSRDRDNYPPSEWLARERWREPVVVDTANGSVANAYGLSSYPFSVLLDAEGDVLFRHSGELTDDRLRDVVALAVSSVRDDGVDEAPVGSARS